MTFNDKSVISLFIVYEINLCSNDLGADFILGNSLFKAVNFTKNSDRGKYSYSGYGVAFNERSAYSLSGGDGFGQTVIIIEVDNRKKDILILGKGPTERSDDDNITVEA